MQGQTTSSSRLSSRQGFFFPPPLKDVPEEVPAAEASSMNSAGASLRGKRKGRGRMSGKGKGSEEAEEVLRPLLP